MPADLSPPPFGGFPRDHPCRGVNGAVPDVHRIQAHLSIELHFSHVGETEEPEAAPGSDPRAAPIKSRYEDVPFRGKRAPRRGKRARDCSPVLRTLVRDGGRQPYELMNFSILTWGPGLLALHCPCFGL